MDNYYINNKQYYLAVFNSKNIAVQLYYLLEKKGNRKFQLLSTPCKIKHGCSYSLKFSNLDDVKCLKEELSDINNHLHSIYFVKRINGTKEYKKVSNII